jgi:serine/threonine protein phosphatase 1
LPGRTFAIGDIHGGYDELAALLRKLPALSADDTIVLLGDYVDRGKDSAKVLRLIRERLPLRIKSRIVALRGNHEDGWIRVVRDKWDSFVYPRANGCLATLRSFEGRPHHPEDCATEAELGRMRDGSFFPPGTIEWMESLPYWYEDEHAIFVHAGLVEQDGAFVHPMLTQNKALLLWVRTMKFYSEYRGKRVVCGHTPTEHLPPEMSSYTPDDPTDAWVGECVTVIDTGCGRGGFLTALELPSMQIYESR